MQWGDNADMIYLDFAHAFDKVDHGILLHKFRKLGISGQVGRWIHNFLSKRYQTVTVNRAIIPKQSEEWSASGLCLRALTLPHYDYGHRC